MSDRDLAARLLAWYDRHRRDLPWRGEVDPYRIWLSEVMLQQTRVETAVPYYTRFLARFPTLASLAAAEEDEVLALWAGLGYYRRARALWRGVREVAARYGGVLPRDEEALRALPGVGPYTAAALRSIAFGERVPAVDANARRVAARLWAIDLPVDRPEGARAVEEALRRALPPDRPGDFNQALMDLGALVCLPRRPRCSACPLAFSCAARAQGRAEELPVRTRRPAVPAEQRVALAVWRGDRLLLERRPEGELLGGLWALPAVRREAGEGEREAARRLMQGLGLAGGDPAPAGRVRHAFSHRRWEIALFRVEACGPEERRFFSPEEAERLPMARVDRRLLLLSRSARSSAASGGEMP